MVTMASDRSNQQWIDALSSEPDEAVLEDLRRVLIKGLRSAFASTADQSFAEDMAQEALVKILKGMHSFRGESRFTTWALTIASRTAWTELRRKRWKDVSLDEIVAAADRLEPASEQPVFQSDPDRQTLMKLLARLIDTTLTERQRKAVVAELAGMPQDQIARQMGSNRNAVYKLVHDARKNLKRGLEAAGFNAATTLAVIER